MSEQTESLDHADSRLPHEIAGITDDVFEREEPAQAAAGEGDSVPDEDGTTPGPDLTWLDNEGLRDTLGSLLAGREDAQEVAEQIQRGFVPKDVFTKKTQAIARERKELEALAEGGKYWQAIQADPGLMDHILAYQRGGGPTEPEPELPKDIFDLDPQQLVQVIEQKEAKKRADLERRLEQLETSIKEQTAPVEHIGKLENAMVEWAEENNVTEEVMLSVGKTLTSEYDLRQISPEALKLFLPRIVHSVHAERQLAAAKEKAQHESSRLSKARTASPQGGVGVSGAVEMSFDQRKAAQEEKLGRPLRADEVTKLAFQDFLSDLGKPERDLDREMKEKGYL